MDLPRPFVEKMHLVFGAEGGAWLERLPSLIALCQERWGLTNLRLAEGLSYNLICFAESGAYGPVVLKLGVPRDELRTEIKALALYAGRPICACYDADPDLGALLLERITPGTDLRSVTDSAERFRIAADLFTRLPLALEGNHGFPTYRDWISRAFARARTEGRVIPALLPLVDAAEAHFAEIDAPHRPRLLLHGDLHHMNILRGEQSNWAAIDPKGVIGVACMGAARFMQNEFGMGDPATRYERLGLMCDLFGQRLGESSRTLARCVFVEHVLATCWSFEENAAPEALAPDVARCAELFAYCQNL